MMAYPRPGPVATARYVRSKLEIMTKADLMLLAEQHSIKPLADCTKAEIVEAIMHYGE